MSRWFVGSSSSNRSGSLTKARASITWRLVPPEQSDKPFVLRQTQAGEYGLDFLINVPAISTLDERLQLRQALQGNARSRIRCVRNLVVFVKERSHFAKASGNDLENRLISIGRNLLLQVRDPKRFRAPEFTVIRYRSAGNDAK